MDLLIEEDALILLRPLRPRDAALHLAGEDAEQVRWLSGRAGTIESGRAWIESNAAIRARGEPLWNFGIWLHATGELVGNVEAKADQNVPGVGPGEANISYVIFPAWRRRGLAARAVGLVCNALRQTGLERAVIRADPDNVASIRVAQRAGFRAVGVVHAQEGLLFRFVKDFDI